MTTGDRHTLAVTLPLGACVDAVYLVLRCEREHDLDADVRASVRLLRETLCRDPTFLEFLIDVVSLDDARRDRDDEPEGGGDDESCDPARRR